MSVFKLPGSSIQANTITSTQLTTALANQISSGGGGGPKVKSLIYPGNDTAANSTGGQTVYINGSGFAANAQVLVNGAAVPSQSFISASNISFSTPALSTGTYPVYVINPEDGGTAILYPGLLISGEPAWVTGSTLSGVDAASAWSISLSATGDAPITYALAAGNTLPSGITLAANGLISGTLSSPPETETTYTFNVVATDAQNQDSTRQFSITASTGEGVLFANNVLLIHANGTNNGNNHAFVDSSNNNFTITRNGNSTQGSYSPFSQTGWSAYFDGTSDSLTAPSNTAFAFGTGDFTIEFWTYFITAATGTELIGSNNSQSEGSIIIGLNNSSYLQYYNGSDRIVDNVAPSTGQWIHIALCRSSGVSRLFKNGNQVGNNFSDSINITSTNSFLIGKRTDGGFNPTQSLTGYISNLRVLKGTALYTTTFTPPTTALTAIANTSLLTCQSNRFIDNSTNAFTITRNGDVSIQAFSPFAPTAAYSTANVGGSAYFDGTGDYLDIPNSTDFDLNSTFTIDCWFFQSTAGNATIFARGGGSGSWSTTNGHQYLLFIEAGAFYWMWNNAGSPTQISVASPAAGAWHHVAVGYNGTTTRVWIDGVSIGTSTTGYTLPTTRNITRVGNLPSNGYNFNGYISQVRVVNGTDVYGVSNTTITVPTSPLTAITNTKLLLSCTNAQIFDQTAKNVLETVGVDSKVSTSVYKYGTGSIYFNGDNNYIIIQPSELFAFRTGNFTVEFWANVSSSGSNQCLIDFRTASDTSQMFLKTTSSSDYELRIGASSVHSFTATANQWNHIAIVRNSGTIKTYVNGTEAASTSNSTNLTGKGLTINRFYDSALGIVGYIDDLRITRGYARYTSNFTPPASAHKDK